MAGIYIHIPFCNSKCAYCGFYSLPSLKLKEQFWEALKAEIVARKEYLQRGPHCGLDPQSPALKVLLSFHNLRFQSLQEAIFQLQGRQRIEPAIGTFRIAERNMDVDASHLTFQ